LRVAADTATPDLKIADYPATSGRLPQGRAGNWAEGSREIRKFPVPATVSMKSSELPGTDHFFAVINLFSSSQIPKCSPANAF